MSFGQWLVEQRNKAGLTQQELADRSGISATYVSAMEREEPSARDGSPRRPRIEKIDKLAKALQVSVNEARLAAGYAPTNAIRKPQTIPELIAALESMGIEPPQLYGGYTQDPDGEGFREIVERIWLDIQLVLNRIAKGQSAGYEVQDITLSEIDHLDDVPIPQLKRTK